MTYVPAIRSSPVFDVQKHTPLRASPPSAVRHYRHCADGGSGRCPSDSIGGFGARENRERAHAHSHDVVAGNGGREGKGRRLRFDVILAEEQLLHWVSNLDLHGHAVLPLGHGVGLELTLLHGATPSQRATPGSMTPSSTCSGPAGSTVACR